MFRGSFVALITPFKDGIVDTDTLKQIVKRCISEGIDGFVPCGTTGEAPVLSDEEYCNVLATVTELSDKKIPVLAGCGTNSTQKTIDKGLLAKQAGADGLLVVTPYYNRPNQESLYQHFVEVATSVELPVILYNVPSRTGVDLNAQTTCLLAKHPLIVGIKEATGSLKRAFDILYNCPPDFTVLSGDDFTALPLVFAGGHGVISVVANVCPGKITAMISDAQNNRLKEANSINKYLYPLMDALFWDTNPVPVKMAMKLLGYGNGLPRLPLLPLNNEKTEQLAILLQKLNFS